MKPFLMSWTSRALSAPLVLSAPIVLTAPTVLASAAFARPAAQDPGQAHSKAPDARMWEHERSDIPVDPRIHFGWLHNGMRYAWMKNTEPKQRCYLRLHVDVGSLGEKDDERGMAHYLEHMAFNGSTHYPPGTLVEWFQRHGMAFGADTNAGTSFSSTVYELDLPTSDEAAISEGLVVLRDFADGLLLEPKEVDSERGVIDAEERERDSPGYRILVKSWEIGLAGTRIPERIPIGVKTVRDQFTSDSIRAFYRRWYRAENMTLLVVGDLGDLDPAPMIEKTFADTRSPSEKLDVEPLVGQPRPPTHAFVVSEPDASAVSISIQRVLPWREEPDDRAHLAEDLPLDVARHMLGLRYVELAKKDGAPFFSASAHSLRGGLRVEDGEELSIACPPEKWAEALEACEVELRRAVKFGFDDAELAEVRADMLRGYDEAVDREKTRSSLACVESLVSAAEDRVVPVSAATEREIMKPLVEALTAKACSDAFAAGWAKGTLLVSASGKLDLGPEGSQKLQGVYEASVRTTVEPRKKEEEKPFAYASDPAKSGGIASRSHVDEFDIEEVVFANGVRLHVRKTDFKEKQLLVSAAIGEGRLSAEPGQDALLVALSEVFELCGLGAHSMDELRRLNAGKVVQVAFGIDTDRFVLRGSTTKEDLLRELELMKAYLTDPGWRDEGLRELKKGIPVYFDALEHQHGGPISRWFVPEFYSGDGRFRFPERSEFETLSTTGMKEWFAPRIDQAPIDLVVVGDADVEAVVAAAARTFGELPERRAAKPFEEQRKAVQMKSGMKKSYEVETDVPKTLVFILFPTTDGRDTSLRRRMHYLSAVLSDRLRVQVREKLGASYSPGAGANLSEVYAGDGWIGIQAMADPEKAEELVEACLSAADEMATKGLSADEVDRQRKPAQAEVRDRVRTNGYWVEALTRLHGATNVFDELRSFEKFPDTVQVADLDPLAKEYLKRERASVAIVAPKKKAEGAAESTPKSESPPKKE
jgi:zinc protease